MLIGTRLLRLKLPDGSVRVPVNLHVPTRSDNAWSCEFEIGWPDGVRRSHAAGIDALQAVHAAMQRIAIELYMSPYHAKGLLAWGDGDDAGYGFPMPKGGRDLLVGYDRDFEG